MDNLDHRRAARSIEEGQLQGGWTFQNATVVRQKIKRTIERELRNQDLMSKEDASKVGVKLQKVCVVNAFGVMNVAGLCYTTFVFSAHLPPLPNSTGEAGIISKLELRNRAARSKRISWEC